MDAKTAMAKLSAKRWAERHKKTEELIKKRAEEQKREKAKNDEKN